MAGFTPRLTIPLPDGGWQSGEDSPAELKLNPPPTRPKNSNSSPSPHRSTEFTAMSSPEW